MSKTIKTTHRNGKKQPAEDFGGLLPHELKTPASPWYRSALADRVPRKHRKARLTAFVVLGAAKAVSIGVSRTASAGAKFTTRKVQDARARREERRADPEWQYRRRFTSAVFLCAPCRTRMASIAELNDHFESVHANEEWALGPQRSAPKIKNSPHSKKTRTTTTTNRSPHPSNGKRTPGPQRTAALIQAYREPMSKIGDRAVTSNLAARMVRAGGKQLGESDPQSLSQMQEDLLGMERALGVLREGLEDYARVLRSRRGHREALAPEVVNPWFGRAVGGLEQTELALTGFIVAFEETYGPAIRAARHDGHGGVKFLAG